MAFSIPRSYTDYGSSNAIASELEGLSGDLSSMNGNFSGALSNVEAARSGINFGDWDDETQNAFENFLTGTVLAALDVVSSNLDAGMAAMMSSVDGIKGEVSGLAAAQEAYVEHVAAEPTKTITTYYDERGNTVSSPHKGGSSYTTINPAWDKWDKSCYQQELAMDRMFDSIDAGFANLASITFSPTGTPQVGLGGAGAGEGNQPDDSTKTEEVPPVFDENGGKDGRHFSSREDAILAYMAANPGVSREEAESIIARRISNATLFIPPDKVDDVIVAGEQLSEEAAMASGIAIPTEEIVETTEPSNRGDTDGDGNDNYLQGQHTEQTFETTDGKEAERVEDLVIAGEIKQDEVGEEKLVPESGTGEAHYTTSDGEKFTGEITIDYTHDGESFQKDESITADSTGEHVADVSTHQVRDYHSDNFGTDNNITDTTIEQGGVATGRREQVEDYGRPGMRYVVSDEWSYVIPEAGQPVTEGRIVLDTYDNPVTYSYERNNQGQLIETYTYPTKKGDQSQTRVVDEHVYLLRVTDPQGQVTETPIILDSQLGNAEFERQYQNAMIDVGWEARGMNHGMYEVRNGTNGSDPVIVKNINDENNEYVYQFEFIYPDDYW